MHVYTRKHLNIEQHTGLKINYEKTTIYRIGSLKNSDVKLYTNKELLWSDGDIDLLGLKIGNGQRTLDPFDEAITKMEQVCTTWYSRQFSLIGKILIINTLMSSLFVYKMLVLPSLTKKQLNRIDTIIRKFLWKNGKAKIQLLLLRNPKDKGGLKLTAIDIRQRALKIAWIPKILQREDLKYVYDWLLPNLGDKVWELNIKVKHILLFIPYNTLWREILIEWSHVHFNEFFSGNEVLEEFLWFNSCICAG